MKLLTKIGITLALISAFVMPFLFASPQVFAQDIPNSLCAGANLDVNSNCSSGVTNQDANAKINDLISDVINIFSLVVGVVSVIMIIIGGFRYITSGGDSGNVTSAKNTILYAVIGLIIVALAQSIVRFVLGRVIEA